MVHFKQMLEKYPWRRRALPCPGEGGIFQNLFENGSCFAPPIFEIAIQPVFQKFTI